MNEPMVEKIRELLDAAPEVDIEALIDDALYIKRRNTNG